MFLQDIARPLSWVTLLVTSLLLTACISDDNGDAESITAGSGTGRGGTTGQSGAGGSATTGSSGGVVVGTGGHGGNGGAAGAGGAAGITGAGGGAAGAGGSPMEMACVSGALCAGAAKRSISPDQIHVDGVQETRYFAAPKTQKFNLGGFGINPFQQYPDPFSAFAESLTEPARRPVFHGARGAEPLWLRALVLEQPGGVRMMFVVIDATGAGNVIQQGLKAAVHQASCAVGACIDESNILFGQTHTHAGPDLQGLWGGVPQDWIRNVLYRAAAEAVVQALHERRRVNLTVQQGNTREFNNYRRPPVDPQADADGTLTLLSARAADGGLVGSVLQYSAHPTSIDETPRTPHADFVLGATDHIESRLGGVALYFNGTIADASGSGSRAGCENHEATADRAYGSVRCRGEGIADAALGYAPRPLAPVLAVRHEEVSLPVTNPLFVGAGLIGGFNRYYDFTQLPAEQIPGIGPQVKAGLVELPQLTPTATTLVSRLTIGNGEQALEIVTIPGEATNTFGQYIRSLSPTPMMLLGLTQNSFGYILPEEEFSYVDPSGDAGFVLPFTGYEEFVSLGPLTAPLLRMQGYNPLFDVGPEQSLPPAASACVDPRSPACVINNIGQRIDYIQRSYAELCRSSGGPAEFCSLLNPDTPLAAPCRQAGLPEGVCSTLAMRPASDGSGGIAGMGGNTGGQGGNASGGTGGTSSRRELPGWVMTCRAYAGEQGAALCDGLNEMQQQLYGFCAQSNISRAQCSLGAGNFHAVIDGCRALDASHSPLCKAADTLMQGAASYCRQMSNASAGGLAPALCAQFGGELISEAVLREHERSWLHRALGLQYELGADQAFVDLMMIATHNSFNATDANTPPTLSGSDPNQRYGAVDELRMGVRALELDVHWTPRADGGFGPTVCHGNAFHFGCTIEKGLEQELRDLRDWMDAHPDQVLWVYLENNLDEPLDAPSAALTGREPQAVVADIITRVLGDVLYRPADHAAVLGRAFTCADGHPLAATVNALRAQGRRLYIQTEGCHPSLAPLVFNKNHASNQQSANKSQLQTFGTAGDEFCGGFTRTDHESRFTRYFEDGTLVGALSSQSDGTLGSVEDFRSMARCAVNMPALDHVTPQDPRLPALVWSWAPDQPAVNTRLDCAWQATDGRYRAGSCTTSRRHACVRRGNIDADPSVETDWQLSAVAGAWDAGASSCPTGFRFGVPGNGFENELLQRAGVAAGVSEIWLNYREQETEGNWSASP